MANALPDGRIDWNFLAETTTHDGVRSRRFDSEALTIILYDLDPRARYPLHMHPHEHFIHGVAGRVTLSLGDDTLDVVPGDLIRVPAGVLHGATATDAGATFLNFGPNRA